MRLPLAQYRRPTYIQRKVGSATLQLNDFGLEDAAAGGSIIEVFVEIYSDTLAIKTH